MRDEMRIEQITLNNYRQYYGKVVVRFAAKENEFSIVVGANGAGKSTRWNAIHWCLCNEEPHLKSDKKPPLINKKYLRENVGGFLTTYVEIIMVKGHDKYLIRRSLAGLLEHLEKDDNGMIRLSKENPVPTGFFIQDRDKSELFQISRNSGAWETKNQSHDFRNLVHEHVIPENLAKFFILDGEFLQDLFGEFENIKSGIDQISQINVLNKTIEETRNVKFKQPKGAGKISEITENINMYERRLASEDKFGRKMYSDTKTVYGTEDSMHAMGNPRKDDLEKSINNMGKELTELGRKIADSNAKTKLEIKDRYANTRQKKKDAETELKTMIQNHIGSILASGPLIMCKPSLVAATASIKAEMDKGKLPNTYKRMMVGDLLAKNTCLCGTALENGTDARRHVEHEMERISDQVQYDIANDMRVNNERFLDGYDGMLQRLDQERESIRIKKKGLDSLSEEMQSLGRRLPENDSDYADMIKRHDELDALRGGYQRELGSYETEIRQWTEAKANETRRYQVAEKRGRENKEAILVIQKASLIEIALEQIKRDVDETIRDKVARKTLEIYNAMAWKKNYEYLWIDGRYQISIGGEDGMDVVGGMAAGEKLFLALSFIMALKNITNYRFPFVIDSPLGKAGGNLKISFGKHMPKLLDGSQMIMRATNTEYSKYKIQPETGSAATHTLKELLEQNGTVHEYEIDFDKEAETARVVTVGRF